jgi:hypothetical protein
MVLYPARKGGLGVGTLTTRYFRAHLAAPSESSPGNGRRERMAQITAMPLPLRRSEICAVRNLPWRRSDLVQPRLRP